MSKEDYLASTKGGTDKAAVKAITIVVAITI